MGKQELKGSQWSDYHKQNQLQTMQLLQPTYSQKVMCVCINQEKAITIQADWKQNHNVK